jgi:hypothetical protein
VTKRVPSPVKASGSHFYRYSSLEHPEWLKKIILEHELYVPSVGQLNDPADGRPLLAPLSEEKMFDFLYPRNPTLTLGAQQNEIKLLRYNIHLHGPEVLQRKMTGMLNRLMEGHRVYSLSKRYDNLSLWAKYAGGHSGYCLEFAKVGEFFERAVEVIYGGTIPMDVTDQEQRKSYFLYCKRPEWSDEEEVRVVVLRGGGSSVKIEPRCLTRVILGMKICGTNEKSIREYARQRSPELVVVKAYFDELDQTLRLR